jgi:hypothetical protein
MIGLLGWKAPLRKTENIHQIKWLLNQPVRRWADSLKLIA